MRKFIFILLSVISIFSCVSNNSNNKTNYTLVFLGEKSIPINTIYNDTVYGGISGIDYNSEKELYYTISDDGKHPRFYEITLNIDKNGINDLKINSIINILDKGNIAFQENSTGPEGIRYNPISKNFYWVSEGNAKQLISPFIRVMNFDGTFINEFDLDKKYFPSSDKKTGIVHNKAFESITFANNYKKMFVATETALIQDGKPASIDNGSPVRIMKYDVTTGKKEAEYLYNVSKIPKAPTQEPNWNDNGLAELLALNDTTLLAIERSYASGLGFTIIVYLVDISNASDISQIDSLLVTTENIIPATKTKLLDFSTLGIKIGNIEGVSFGPKINGNKTLLFVADDNFGFLKDDDANQLLLFLLK